MIGWAGGEGRAGGRGKGLGEPTGRERDKEIDKEVDTEEEMRLRANTKKEKGDRERARRCMSLFFFCFYLGIIGMCWHIVPGGGGGFLSLDRVAFGGG